MGTPCSLDLWQCMLMCLFRLNLVVKLLPQLSQLWMALVPLVSLFLLTLDCACRMITGDRDTGAAAAELTTEHANIFCESRYF